MQMVRLQLALLLMDSHTRSQGVCMCVLGHEQMLIFKHSLIFNFECSNVCLLCKHPCNGYLTHWSIYAVTILWFKPQMRYLPFLTYSNKVTFCIKFAHKSGINTINECLGAKIYWWMLHKRMFQHLCVCEAL